MRKIKQIAPLKNEFTSVLDGIALMHDKLYYIGNLPEKRLLSVAIVGTRKPTAYGQEVGYKIAFELAKKGVAVISGLALGTDAIAHRAALDAGGLTLAVLANGVDDITPRTNRALGERILDSGGAILSEYEPGVPPYATQFLARNRIVSGLADALIVIEAAGRSGTLSTAAHALGQGKHIFAVPGNINSPMSAGCNALIKQGAFPLTSADDVLEVIAPGKLEQAELDLIGDNDIESGIIKMIKEGVRDGEVIARMLKLAPSDFNQAVTMMELKGQIRALGANKWSLK